MEKRYTSEPELRNFRRFFISIFEDLSRSNDIAWNLFKKSIFSQYRQTVFGYISAFFPLVFITLTFVLIRSQGIISYGETEFPYVVFIITGVVLWQIFTDSMNLPASYVNKCMFVIKKIMMPREALLIAAVYECGFNFLIRTVFIIVIFYIYDVNFSANMFLSIFGVIALMVFGLMVGIYTIPLSILYKDIAKSLLLINSAWFMLTPVAYSISDVPDAYGFVHLNPVAPLLLTTRHWLLGTDMMLLTPFITVLVVSIVLFVLGMVIYRVSMPHIIVRMGA